ncbi:hypothetical protein ACN20G_11920 [Streptomyces sp. BI20]|uniref:hypothetical protein n=1 Tax=Streptomyces sp. BI20 TaxID=3403460 RepID=UPI003C742F83
MTGARDAADALKAAELIAAESTAALIRLYDGNVELVADLLSLNPEDLDKSAKGVSAARARAVIAELGHKVDRPRLTAPSAAGPGAGVDGTTVPGSGVPTS